MSQDAEKLFDEIEQDLPPVETEKGQGQIEPVPAAVPEPDGKMLSPIFRMLADGAAPNWKVRDDECLELGRASEVYINETWGGLDNVPSWVTLLLAVGMVIVPRLGIPLRDEPAKKLEPGAPADEVAE